MDEGFLVKLEALRVSYGESFKPNSAFRCPKHNAAIGGEPQSMHMRGLACDIPVTDPAGKWRLAKQAFLLDMTVIVYPTFLHVDNRPGQPLLLVGPKRV